MRGKRGFPARFMFSAHLMSLHANIYSNVAIRISINLLFSHPYPCVCSTRSVFYSIRQWGTVIAVPGSKITNRTYLSCFAVLTCLRMCLAVFFLVFLMISSHPDRQGFESLEQDSRFNIQMDPVSNITAFQEAALTGMIRSGWNKLFFPQWESQKSDVNEGDRASAQVIEAESPACKSSSFV